jgi:hypothetical protein
MSTVSFRVPLPDDLSAGFYTVRLTMRDAGTGQPLPARANVSGEAIAAPATLGTIEVVILPDSPSDG